MQDASVVFLRIKYENLKRTFSGRNKAKLTRSKKSMGKGNCRPLLNKKEVALTRSKHWT